MRFCLESVNCLNIPVTFVQFCVAASNLWLANWTAEPKILVEEPSSTTVAPEWALRVSDRGANTSYYATGTYNVLGSQEASVDETILGSTSVEEEFDKVTFLTGYGIFGVLQCK